MAFLRSAYPVDYVPIQVARRVGNNSHIRPIKDGLRFLLILFKIATLYSPLKLFAPLAMSSAAAGLGWYGWSFHEAGRFHNMRDPKSVVWGQGGSVGGDHGCGRV